MTTRERIIESALDLFSKRGYEAVTVEDIAVKVGIKAPSLYKHFKGKRDIFNALLEETKKRFFLFLPSIRVDGERKVPPKEEEIEKTALELLEYSIHDPFTSAFRRMMTIEQFSTPETAEIYSRQYLYMMLDYHTALFSSLMDKGAIKKCDAEAAAMMYGSVITVLIEECDRHPEKEEEAKKRLRRHVRLFYSLLSNNTIGEQE